MQPDYNYLDRLNPQQRAAVEYSDGPSLVIAGAGSGKTRVLTYKIVHLLALGYQPERLMALTFTNKAAREMKERIAQVVGYQAASKIWMGTFHSIFLRILRQHADLIGYNQTFTIYDAADSKALIKSIIHDLALDDKIYRPGTIASVISNAKNRLLTPDAYAKDAACIEEDRRAGRPMTAEIFRLYSKRCRLGQAMDFDDILVYMNILLRDNADLRQQYQEFFRYILVDEYQDTNFAQHLAIRQLAGPQQKVCVVGDDAQSIYSFRGADIQNILQLQTIFKGLRIFKLERNYRSTQNIINAAGSLIAKNAMQMPKNVYSENEEGTSIDVIRTYSDEEESKVVAARIRTMRVATHDSFDEYAILYRTNAQSRVLENELRRLGISYRIYGGVSFYQRKEIKDAICYFRLAVNPEDDQAMLRIINYPARGIGKTTVDKLRAAALNHGVSLWNVLNNIVKYDVKVHSGTLRKLNDFRDIIQSFVAQNNSNDNDAYSMAQAVMNRSRLISSLANENTPEVVSQKENLAELLAAAKAFVDQAVEMQTDTSMYAFLSDIALATDMDSADEREIADANGRVTLMTVHASKGLEFKHVFIVGLEEDLFPSQMSYDTAGGIEEERRLMYVAMTRAKTTCTISYATSRFRNGQIIYSRPSRFIKDIDPKYLSFVAGEGAAGGYGRKRSPYSRPTSNPIISDFNPPSGMKKVTADTPAAAGTHSAAELAEGMKIKHTTFGIGVIDQIDASGPNQIIHVSFETHGSKKLLLKFAKFEIL